MYLWTRVPQAACGGQKTTVKFWFSLSILLGKNEATFTVEPNLKQALFYRGAPKNWPVTTT